MSEEAVRVPTLGVGPRVNGLVPRKRLRAAHRRYRRAGGQKSLRDWAFNGSGMNELAHQWMRNKKGKEKQ